MDELIDELARMLARGTSRKTFLKFLGAGVAGLVAAPAVPRTAAAQSGGNCVCCTYVCGKLTRVPDPDNPKKPKIVCLPGVGGAEFTECSTTGSCSAATKAGGGPNCNCGVQPVQAPPESCPGCADNPRCCKQADEPCKKAKECCSGVCLEGVCKECLDEGAGPCTPDQCCDGLTCTEVETDTGQCVPICVSAGRKPIKGCRKCNEGKVCKNNAACGKPPDGYICVCSDKKCYPFKKF